MKKTILAIAFSFSLMSQAEAKTQYQIKILPANGQAENWQNGIHYVDDIKPTSTVRIVSAHDALPNKQSTFRVLVLNKSNKPITFGPENVFI